jgi:hypothetical protein
MPYIATSERKHLDPHIEALAQAIAGRIDASGDEKAFAGLLNYACTRIALLVIKNKFGRIRYWLIALVSGVFANMGAEFYRRLGEPYEDKQISASGDVPEFEDLTASGEGAV